MMQCSCQALASHSLCSVASRIAVLGVRRELPVASSIARLVIEPVTIAHALLAGRYRRAIAA